MYYQKENKENGGTQNERIFCKKAGNHGGFGKSKRLGRCPGNPGGCRGYIIQKEYDKFRENLMEDYEFISQHTRKTGVKDGQFSCILVRKAGTKHTAIAVQSDGYDYARYAARVRA